MYFGIRGKVALLVMLATAACALLVATALSHRATDILREHELVDLGDEASLKGWQIIDQVAGLQGDILSLAYSPPFREAVINGASQKQLSSMVRGLCRHQWKMHLRFDIVAFEEGEQTFQIIEEKASIAREDLWFPEKDSQAGERIHLSNIRRALVTRTDLGGSQELQRIEPVIWAVAPLTSQNSQPLSPPTYIRIMMSLYATPSSRHLYSMVDTTVMKDAEGNVIPSTPLIRHDETKPLNGPNDAIFEGLNENEDVKVALEISRGLNKTPGIPVAEPKVDKLQKLENVPLEEPYYFIEGEPRKKLREAINSESEATLDDFIELLEVKIGDLGRAGGLKAGVKELRLLANSAENLADLKKLVETELETYFCDAYDGLDWRSQVECDMIHSWAVRLLVGEGALRSEYLLQYAVLDDELASSIEYEMTELRNLALLVAGGFGIIGFLIAMHFIRPLKQMTTTAQQLTASHQDRLYKKVGVLARTLDIKRRDEVGDIARASKRLFEELIASQNELEERVNERTLELRRSYSELETANEKLMSLSHEKDAFVAKVSHDLRQPLNAIFLQVEALKLSDLDEMQKSDVQRIHDHAARELNLVNDILEYQKIIMGAETLSKDTIDVAKLIHDLKESHEPSLREKEVKMETGHAKDIGSLVADDRRVRQILGNLVGNACKFTKEGTVTVDARPREINGSEWVEFTVTDTGRGMSPDEQAKAFVPFVSNKKDNAGGSGLGLSICKELVSQMGGKIGFVSELGKGTHFSIFIPREPSSEHYDPPRELSLPASPALPANDSGEEIDSVKAGGTILVIDDDGKVRELLGRILEHDGYRVLKAADGATGLEMAHTHHPDAITLDVVMPGGKDGWDVLRELKESPITNSIPVIMVSVMAEQENGLALDVEDYLVKPIDVDRLGRVISRITARIPQRNILLVDDEQDSLDSLSRILENEGWHPTLAHDGQEALDVLEKTRPAAIVLDLLMPGMDGFEFLQHVQRDPKLRSIPVIVMSGKDPDESEQEFLEKRVTAVLRKGSNSTQDLLANINERIRSSRID
ncbi:response regulator [Verrucomicrobiales bacterium BCK34]|nr:response regulator [Verrucomicrobiales bacterium BCK34]